MYVCVYMYILTSGCQVVWEANFLQWRVIAYLLAFTMFHVPFHLSGAWNLEVAATFLYSMCTLGARGGAVG